MTTSALSTVIYGLIQSAGTQGFVTHIHAHECASSSSAVAGRRLASRGRRREASINIIPCPWLNAKEREQSTGFCPASSTVQWASTLTPRGRVENNFPGQRQAEAIGWRELRAVSGERVREEESEGLYVRQEGREDVFVPDIWTEKEREMRGSRREREGCAASLAAGTWCIGLNAVFNPPHSSGSLSFQVQLD